MVSTCSALSTRGMKGRSDEEASIYNPWTPRSFLQSPLSSLSSVLIPSLRRVPSHIFFYIMKAVSILLALAASAAAHVLEKKAVCNAVRPMPTFRPLHGLPNRSTNDCLHLRTTAPEPSPVRFLPDPSLPPASVQTAPVSRV